MKKELIIFLLIIILTGCGKKKIEKIECKISGEFMYGTVNETVYIELQDKELKSFVQRDEFILGDINIPYIDVYYEKKDKEIEEERNVYNYDIDYEKTSTGAIVTTSFNKEQASEFFGFGNKYSKDKIIESLRKNGFTCND